MPDVDTSSYKPLQSQQQQLGPLQVLQAIGQLNQNRLFQQEFDSRQKIGNAYQESYDPTTNTVDNNKLNALIRASGYHAPEAVRQGIENESASTDLNTKYQQIMRGIAGQRSTQANITDDDQVKDRATMAAQGVPGTLIQKFYDKVPSASTRAGQAALKDFAVTANNLARGAEAVGQKATGPVGPNGQRPEISEGQAARLRAGVTPGTPATPDVPAVPAQVGMQTELPHGANIRLENAGTRMAVAQERAANYGAEMFPMEQALTNLQKLGPTGTGAGKAEINTIKNFIQANLGWLPGAEKISGNPEDIKSFDEATKYLTNMAGARASAFGHGTDQALSTALTASPNTHISNLAAVDLTKATIALRRMDQVQALEMADKKISEAQYPNWAAKWATTVDPRAFMVDKMNKDQLEAVEKTLTTPEKRRRFNMSVQKAVDSGVLELPK